MPFLRAPLFIHFFSCFFQVRLLHVIAQAKRIHKDCDDFRQAQLVPYSSVSGSASLGCTAWWAVFRTTEQLWFGSTPVYALPIRCSFSLYKHAHWVAFLRCGVVRWKAVVCSCLLPRFTRKENYAACWERVVVVSSRLDFVGWYHKPLGIGEVERTAAAWRLHFSGVFTISRNQRISLRVSARIVSVLREAATFEE